MRTIFSGRVFLASLLASVVITASADDEQDQIAVLRSDASVAQKWAACQKLRVIGTAKSVPEVAALLTDEHLSQAARQTLGGLPYPEVDDVLRQAFDKTAGLLKAGIIDSIGWRGKPAAVPLLIPPLSDSDTNVAAAAATALGRLGGEDAISALSAARDRSPDAVQAAVLASLLQCAESLAENDHEAGAVAIYRELYSDHYPLGIRTAAWRGLVLSDSAHQAELMEKALDGTDPAVELVALKVLRESNDPRLIRACVNIWASLPAESQLAVIDAEVKQGHEALPFVRAAGRSAHPAVRLAALTGLGDLNDLGSVGALAQAAAGGEGAERQAARDSLARLRGPGASEVFEAELEQAAPLEKAELLRALGARRDGKAVSVLLRNAADGGEPVRLAALQSLTEIASPDALRPLLEIAEKAGSDDVRNQALEALSAICQANPDKDMAARAVIEAQGHLPATAPGAFLPLLAELGTADALAAVDAASRGQDLELAKEAVRALSQWPNAAPAAALLELARTATNPLLRTLALRGAITVSGAEAEGSRRLALLQQALAEADRSDEKKLALSQLGQVSEPEALDLALHTMSDSNVSHEAALAVVTIAEKLAPAHHELADEAAVKVLQQPQGGEGDGDLFRRAWALRHKPGKDIPFIRDWLVCGPYSRQGAVGAKAIFNIPFGPETRGQQVEWKAAPAEDHVNLGAIFPGAENCAAYLRASIVALEDCSGMLLMGSDDGIKAWLNGAVVHANNVDRGEVADQDIAPIKLKKGANELVCKITQGGGGWSACVRIVGADGNPIPGLRVERPAESAGKLMGAE
jgi:HEAT repeat protein